MTRSIPKVIRLPFGYRAVVKQVRYDELLCMGSEDPCLWDSEQKILFLDEGLSLVEKRYWVMSQLHHIVLDANHEYLDAGIMKPNG